MHTDNEHQLSDKKTLTHIQVQAVNGPLHAMLVATRREDEAQMIGAAQRIIYPVEHGDISRSLRKRP